MLLIALVAAIDVLPADAQDFGRRGFEITPYVAAFAPTGSLVRDSVVLVEADGSTDGTRHELTIRSRAGMMAGLRLARWFNGRLGSELELGYAPTGTRAAIRPGTADQSGSVFLVNGRVMLALGDPDADLSYLAFAGLGATDLGGKAWEGVAHTIGLGGVLGGGARWAFSGGDHTVRLELASHFYSVGPLAGGYSEPGLGSMSYRSSHRRLLHAFVVALGVSLPLGGD